MSRRKAILDTPPEEIRAWLLDSIRDAQSGYTMFVCDELPYIKGAPDSWATAVGEVVSEGWRTMGTDILLSCVQFLQKSNIHSSAKLKATCQLLEREPCVGTVLSGLDVLPRLDESDQLVLERRIFEAYGQMPGWRKFLLRLDGRFLKIVREGRRDRSKRGGAV